jgi:hypothetical protein
MRKLAWWQHGLLALLVAAVIFAVFTLFLEHMPDPEDFSPQVYFVACLLLLAGSLRLQRAGRHPLQWAYWLLLALCVLIFLDEIAYGVELLGFQPIYIERYHFYIRDLHSSIGFVQGVVGEWLQKGGWNAGLFAGLLQLNAALGAALLLLWWLMRRGLPASDEAAWRLRMLRVAAGASLLASLAALLYLLQLPADPKHGVWLGFSVARLGGLLLLAAAAGLAGWALRALRPGQAAPAWLARRLPGGLQWLLAAIVLAALYFQFRAGFLSMYDELTRLARQLPLVLWAQAQALLAWLALLLWNGRLRRSLGASLRSLLQALRQNPAFIYVLVALGLILIAQLIDQNYLPLNNYISTPNYYIHDWAIWTEETFEMIGAFLFALAALVMPRTPSQG